MRINNFRWLAALVLALIATTGSARNFFDTSEPAQVFNLGVRVGLNTSNRTMEKEVFNLWNKNSWGTGFDLGVVADINIRDFIALQPGLFFETRSGNYSYITTLPATRLTTLGGELVQVGHSRRYTLNIPLLCSVRFNVSDDVRWSLDLGPYIAMTLRNDDDKAVYNADLLTADLREVKPSNFDFGFKMGSGVNIRSHYYFGIHYLAGCLRPWKVSALGGRNKAWTFTVGYDF